MRLWFKNIYLSKQCDARRMLSEFPDNSWKVGSIDSLLKRIRKTDCPASRQRETAIRRIAVEDLVLSQEDKPKRHRWAREISHETVILRSSVNRIIHRDVQLKCFIATSCSAVVWSQSHHPSHSLINNLTVCNKSWVERPALAVRLVVERPARLDLWFRSVYFFIREYLPNRWTYLNKSLHGDGNW